MRYHLNLALDFTLAQTSLTFGRVTEHVISEIRVCKFVGRNCFQFPFDILNSENLRKKSSLKLEYFPLDLPGYPERIRGTQRNAQGVLGVPPES